MGLNEVTENKEKRKNAISRGGGGGVPRSDLTYWND